MQLIQSFDATKHDPSQSIGQLPVGRHPVIVETSEVKANKANDGGYLQLNLRIIDGPLAGGQGAYRLNLYHSNQQTVEIANRQLSAICHVTGVFQVNDSSQLHNIPFMIEVAPQKDPQYTEVKKVFDMNGNEPGQAGAGGQQQQPQNAFVQQGNQQQPQGGQQQQPANNGGQWGNSQQGNQQQPQNNQQPQGGGQWGQQPQGGAQPQGQWGQQGGQQQQPQNNQAPQGGNWQQGGQQQQPQGGGNGNPWAGRS